MTTTMINQIQLRNKRIVDIVQKRPMNHGLSKSFCDIRTNLNPNHANTAHTTYALVDIDQYTTIDTTSLRELNKKIIHGRKSINNKSNANGTTTRRFMEYKDQTHAAMFPFLKDLIEMVLEWTEHSHDITVANVIHSRKGINIRSFTHSLIHPFVPIYD